MFHHKGNGRIPLDLPEPIGPVQTISEKLYVPVKEHPDVRTKNIVYAPKKCHCIQGNIHPRFIFALCLDELKFAHEEGENNTGRK